MNKHLVYNNTLLLLLGAATSYAQRGCPQRAWDDTILGLTRKELQRFGRRCSALAVEGLVPGTLSYGSVVDSARTVFFLGMPGAFNAVILRIIQDRTAAIKDGRAVDHWAPGVDQLPLVAAALPCKLIGALYLTAPQAVALSGCKTLNDGIEKLSPSVNNLVVAVENGMAVHSHAGGGLALGTWLQLPRDPNNPIGVHRPPWFGTGTFSALLGGAASIVDASADPVSTVLRARANVAAASMADMAPHLLPASSVDRLSVDLKDRPSGLLSDELSRKWRVFKTGWFNSFRFGGA